MSQEIYVKKFSLEYFSQSTSELLSVTYFRNSSISHEKHYYIAICLWKYSNFACRCKAILYFVLEITSKVRRLDSLNPRLKKAEVYLSHVLISEKCFYQLYLNKQDKSLCFRRDIRKKIFYSRIYK